MEILLAIFLLVVAYNVDVTNLNLKTSKIINKSVSKNGSKTRKINREHPPVKGNPKGFFDEKAFTHTYYKMKEWKE